MASTCLADQRLRNKGERTSGLTGESREIGEKKNTWIGGVRCGIRIPAKFNFKAPAAVSTNREDRGNPLKNAD